MMLLIGGRVSSRSVQILLNLILFILQLFFIRQHLPFAAPANAEMTAKRDHPVTGIFMEMDGLSFGPFFFVFGKLNIHDVTGNRPFYKNDSFHLFCPVPFLQLHNPVPEYVAIKVFSLSWLKDNGSTSSGYKTKAVTPWRDCLILLRLLQTKSKLTGIGIVHQ